MSIVLLTYPQCSISAPKGWVDNTAISILLPYRDKFQPNVRVEFCRLPSGITLEQCVAEDLERFKQMPLKGLKQLSNQASTLGSCEAWELEFSYYQDPPRYLNLGVKTIQFRQRSLLAVHQSKLYTLVCLDLAESFEEHQEAFESFRRSFQPGAQ